MKQNDDLQQVQQGIFHQHLSKEHLPMPSRQQSQSQHYQSLEPIRVLPANPEGIEITNTPSGSGYLQIDIPSTISRDRRGPRRAVRLDVCPDGTVDFQMYGDVGDITFAVQSTESGSLDLLLFPYAGINEGWRIPIDKILDHYSKQAPKGGNF